MFSKQEPPEAPNNVEIVFVSSRTCNITWSRPYDGKSPILHYIFEYKLTKGNFN